MWSYEIIIYLKNLMKNDKSVKYYAKILNKGHNTKSCIISKFKSLSKIYWFIVYIFLKFYLDIPVYVTLLSLGKN